MADNGDLVRLASLRYQRSRAAAIRTLQVLEDDQRDRRALGRTKGTRYFLREGSQGVKSS